jgi:exosortase/archaeosortase family protein
VNTSTEWPARVWARIALAVGLFVSIALPAERSPSFLLALPSVNALTAQAAELTLARLGVDVHREHSILTHPGGFGYEIVLSCTGIVPAGLLAVAILAAGAPLRSRLRGAALGVVAVLFVNLVRLVTLFCVGVRFPASFGFAHSVVWEGLTILFLLAFFQTWRHQLLARSRGRKGALQAAAAPGRYDEISICRA